MKSNTMRLLAMTIAVQAAFVNCQANPTGVGAARLEKLTRGLNLFNWFSPDRTPEYSFITPEETSLIKKLGFRHVRVCVDAFFIFDPENPEKINVEHLAYLDKALDMIHAQGLAVVVNIMDPDNKSFESRLPENPEYVDKFCRFWTMFAKHLSTRDPETLFLEIMNEPVYPGNVWVPMQEKLVAAIRKGAPRHTIIASGGQGSFIDGLLEITPLADSNVVYTVHFYEPTTFCMQGAEPSWMPAEYQYIQKLPYPSDPESVRPVIASFGDKGTDKDHVTAKYLIEQYGNETWNMNKIDGRIRLISKWSRQNKAKVIVGEFGSLGGPGADPEARARFLHDVRVTLEKYHIPWCMWEYLTGYGIGKPGMEGSNHLTNEDIDPRIIRALLAPSD